MSNQVITIKWSIAELGQYCSNVSAYVASTMAQDGNTFDIFVMTEDNNVTFLKENVSAAILALTPFFSRITPDNFEPINNDVEVGLSFVPRIEGGEYSRTELAYVDSLCKRYIANYILNAWYAQHNADGLVAYFANSNLVVARDLKDALVRFIRPVRSATSSIRKVSYNYQQPQTTYKHINNRSDFALLWRAKDNLPLPEFNYDLIFFTDGKNAYTVNSESLYFKPIKNEDNKMMGARIIFDFSRQDAEFFNNGVLKYKMYGQVPDADFPDGFRSFEMEDSTDVEIWDKASDTDVDMVTTYIPSYVKLTFDDLTEEDIQQLQTPALQAKAEWDGVKPTIDKAISDATAAIEGATTATKSATASATNANAAATQARSQGNTAEERGKNAAKAADDANNRMVEINTEFSNKMDEVDGKVATAEAQFATAISEINDAITNGERAVESIRDALTEVDNKIGEADTAILGANKAKDDANTAKNAANAAAMAANGVANDFLQAENQRVSNEEKRVDAETLREGAEILRAEAERNRAAIESGRVAAESARVNAENAREVNAAKAISDMQKASTDAINEMKSTTNTTIGNVNKVVSDAVISADSATDRANTAANEAEEAAASANAAKESIQEELGAKADKTGEYKELTAGFANKLSGNKGDILEGVLTEFVKLQLGTQFNGRDSVASIGHITLATDGDYFQVEVMPSQMLPSEEYAFAYRGNNQFNIGIGLGQSSFSLRADNDTWIANKQSIGETKTHYIFLVKYEEGGINVYVDGDNIFHYSGQPSLTIGGFGVAKSVSTFWSGAIGSVEANGIEYKNIVLLPDYKGSNVILTSLHSFVTAEQAAILEAAKENNTAKVIVEATSNLVNVYSKTNSKYLKFGIVHKINNADTGGINPYCNLWGVYDDGGVYEDVKGTLVATGDKILIGAENEWAMYLGGMGDFTGGYHGNERIDLDATCYCEFVVDGKPYTIAELVDAGKVECDTFSYRQRSQIFASYTYNQSHIAIGYHFKETSFNNGRMVTENYVEFDFTGLGVTTLDVWSAYAALFCVNKDFASVVIGDNGIRYQAIHPNFTATLVDYTSVPNACVRMYNGDYSVVINSEIVGSNVKAWQSYFTKRVEIMDRKDDTKYYGWIPCTNNGLTVQVETGSYIKTRGELQFNV